MISDFLAWLAAGDMSRTLLVIGVACLLLLAAAIVGALILPAVRGEGGESDVPVAKAAPVVAVPAEASMEPRSPFRRKREAK